MLFFQHLRLPFDHFTGFMAEKSTYWITLWHGTSGAKGLRLRACPIACVQLHPILLPSSLYDIVFPQGIERSSRYTFLWNSVMFVAFSTRSRMSIYFVCGKVESRFVTFMFYAKIMDHGWKLKIIIIFSQLRGCKSIGNSLKCMIGKIGW